jgi:hypothetical protein
MSAPNKLRGSEKPEESPQLTRLKALWQKSLSEDAKEFWRSLFCSETPQSEIRKQLFTKLKINLAHDSQLTRFRKWDDQQVARDEEAERMRADELQLTKEFGDNWTLDQIREEVLKKSYARSIATGDFKHGLKTVDKDIKVRSQQFEEEKFKESLRDKLQAGLDAVAEAFKKNPQAMEFYKQARALISRETK